MGIRIRARGLMCFVAAACTLACSGGKGSKTSSGGASTSGTGGSGGSASVATPSTSSTSTTTASSGGASSTTDGTSGSATGGTGGTGGTIGTGGSGGALGTGGTGGFGEGGMGADTGSGGGDGTGGSSGSAGNSAVECLENAGPSGERGTCADLDPSGNSCCTLCAAAHCCDGLLDCFAIQPSNVCGAPDGGEISAIQQCMIDNEALPGTGSGSDLESCIGEAVSSVSAPVCGLGTISLETADFAVCLHGNDTGLGGCFEECFTDYDESYCLY